MNIRLSILTSASNLSIWCIKCKNYFQHRKYFKHRIKLLKINSWGPILRWADSWHHWPFTLLKLPIQQNVFSDKHQHQFYSWSLNWQSKFSFFPINKILTGYQERLKTKKKQNSILVILDYTWNKDQGSLQWQGLENANILFLIGTVMWGEESTLTELLSRHDLFHFNLFAQRITAARQWSWDSYPSMSHSWIHAL